MDKHRSSINFLYFPTNKPASRNWVNISPLCTADQWFSNSSRCQNHLVACSNTGWLSLPLRVSEKVGLGWDPRRCISIKFPGESQFGKHWSWSSWSLDQPHQHHLGTCQKCTFPGLAPTPLLWKCAGWAQRSAFAPPPHLSVMAIAKGKERIPKRVLACWRW